MRVEISLTFDENTLPIIRARAAADGLELSRWVERAALHAVASDELDLLDGWDADQSPQEQAVTEALAALDRTGA